VKEIVADPKLVAFCGLYCGACKAYLKDRCLGCHENTKATWCRVRTCCMEASYSSCADCKEFDEPRNCRRFHNFISRIIGFALRSDRPTCIMQIKQLGLEDHAKNMAECRRMTIRP